MKKLILFSVGWVFLINTGNAQTLEEYTYPFRPGSQEWKNTKTHDDLRSHLQIPKTVIASLSTQSLLNSVLHYPLIGDLLVFNNFKTGIDNMKKNFPALTSLLHRKDVVGILLETHRKYNPKLVSSFSDPIEVGEFMMQICLLEFMICDELVLSKMTNVDAKEFGESLISMHSKKLEAIEWFGDLGLSSGSWSLARLVNSTKNALIWDRKFIDEGYTLSLDNQEKLIKEATKIIN